MEQNFHQLSFWHDSLPGELTARPPLPGDTEADVVIVGAGYTGLWTAWHLACLDPTLRIVVLEKNQAGFGASGRNGGWALGEFGISPMTIAASSSTDAALRQMRALYQAVDDIGAVAAAEGIEDRKSVV